MSLRHDLRVSRSLMELGIRTILRVTEDHATQDVVTDYLDADEPDCCSAIRAWCEIRRARREEVTR